MRPHRFQLSRAKGWRMPAGGIKCDRSTRRGNPWIPGKAGMFRPWFGGEAVSFGRALSVAEAVELHRLWLLGELGCVGGALVAHPAHGLVMAPYGHAEAIAELSLLRGRDLGCWCGADGPCHVDTWLVLANAGDDGGYGVRRSSARTAAAAALAERALPGSPTTAVGGSDAAQALLAELAA